MIEEIVAHIKAGEGAEAYIKLPANVKKQCIGLIISKQKVSKNEAISILFEAFDAMCGMMNRNDFVYQNEPAFINYLKKICVSKAREYSQETKGTEFLLSTESLEDMKSDFEEEFYQTLKEDCDQLGLPTEVERPDGRQKAIPLEIISIFHSLKDECKLLIILKDVLNHTHLEIYEALSLFYEIKNPQVCKTKLARCRKAMKKK